METSLKTPFSETPLISVIIPYFKGERFIGETLDSVFRQNYPSLEIIVVNDGSPAESLAVLDPFTGKITLISQENKGQAAARNTGIAHARGELIAFLDQDDIWPDDHLALLLPHVTGPHPHAYSQGYLQEFQIDHNGITHWKEPLLHHVMIGTSLFRAETVKAVGPFDESMREGEDFDWTVRLDETRLIGKTIPETTFFYRRHEDNYSNTADFVAKGEFLTIRKKLERLKTERAQSPDQSSGRTSDHPIDSLS